MKSSKAIVSIFFQFTFFIFLTDIASAETYTWTGAINSNWLDSGNWSPTGVPGGGDDVIIEQSDNDPEIDDQVIAAKHIVVEHNAILIISAEYGLGQLFCNSLRVKLAGSLINRSQLFIWHTEESPFGNNYAFESFGISVNLESGSEFGETGLLTISSDLWGAMASTDYFHNTGRIQINYTEIESLTVDTDDSIFLNDGIINIYESNSHGIHLYDGANSTFDNNGIINIRKTAGIGIRCEIPFYNGVNGVINIGQEGESISRHGIVLIDDTQASLNNDGGIIRIDNAAVESPSWKAIKILNSNLTNQNGGQILIGQEDGNIGSTGICLENESTLTNINSTIKINNTAVDGIYMTGSVLNNEGDGLIEVSNTGEVGIYVLNSSSMQNKNNAVIDVDDTGLSGIQVVNSSTYTNTNYSTCRIDNTGNPGLSIINSSDFVNRGEALIVISENGVSGTGPSGLEYALYFQGTDNYFINYECAEMHLYQPVQLTNDENNDLFNTSYIFIDTDGFHSGMSSLVNNGAICYNQENYFDGLINQGVLVKPLTLEECEIENVIEYGGSNPFTVASTWFSDEAMTIEAGTYSQATNTFKITNLPGSSTSNLYFNVISTECSFQLQTTLIIDNFNEGEIVWTGEQSNNWHSSCNWFPQVVPGQESNIIIPSTATAPTINNGVEAFGKSIHIEAGANLEIMSANSLTIEGAELGVNALINDGTLTNDGIIIVKDCMSKSIVNQGTLVNNTYGIIRLHDGGSFAFEQGGGANGSFVNNGLLEIYNINSRAISLASGQIENNHIIEIGFKGVNSLANIDIDGINLSGGSTFTNNENGSLRIKNIGNVGITNFFGTFENEGIIEIDDTAFSGIWNAGNFDNNGNLQIGMNGTSDNIAGYGIRQTFIPNFKNLEDGVIEIANTAMETLGHFAGSFENSGNVFSHGQILIDPNRTLRLKSGTFEILNE